MIDRWRHFCYNKCKPNTLHEKVVASTHEFLGECTLNQTNVLQYAINQTVRV